MKAAPLPLFDRPLAVGDMVRSRRGNVGEVLAITPQGGRLLAIVRRRDGQIVPAWPEEITRIEDRPEDEPAAVRIARPGCYQLAPEIYHADPCPSPSLSSTLARAIITKSPAHAAAMAPRLTRHPETMEGDALDRGAALHELLFGLDERRVEIVHAKSWRGGHARAQRARIRAAGRVPVLASDLPRMLAQVQAARRQLRQSRIPEAFDLDRGAAEQSLFWQEAGTWQRAREDWSSHDRRLLLDYKTTARSLPDWTRYHFKDARLDVQAAHYRAAHRAVFGITPRFAFVVQEIAPPYALAVIEIPPPIMDAADRDLAQARAAWRRGLESDDWPGYPAARVAAPMPRPRRKAQPSPR